MIKTIELLKEIFDILIELLVCLIKTLANTAASGERDQDIGQFPILLGFSTRLLGGFIELLILFLFEIVRACRLAIWRYGQSTTSVYLEILQL